MKTILSAFLLFAAALSAARPAVASTWGGVKVFSSGTTSTSTGTVTDGANLSANRIVANQLVSTGTAPSLTATGAVFTGSVSIPSGGLSVSGQSGMVVRIGTITNTASANPTQLSLGGPYNNSAAGNTLKSKLLVYDDGTSGAGLSFSSTGDGTSLEYNTSGGFDHTWYNGGVEVMRLKDSTRQLLFGAAPTKSTFTSTGQLAIQSGETVGTGLRLRRSAASSSNVGLLDIWHDNTGSANGWSFSVDTNKYMTLNNLGNLGIGTASPASKLHLSSGTILVDGNVTPALKGSGTGSAQIRMDDSVGTQLIYGAATFTQSGAGGVESGTFTAGTSLSVDSAYFGVKVTNALGLYSRTIAQLKAITITEVGQTYYCNDCSPKKIVITTGTSAGNFADAIGGSFQ